MFYYYGRKAGIAHKYPEPRFPTIVEPFAGSAAYSLHGDRWRSAVVLVEKNPRVAELWRWLITASPEDILAVPPISPGDKVTDLLRILHAATKGAFGYRTITVTPMMATNWNRNRLKMAASIHKVKHWQIVEGDYTEAPDIDATWFIDPPYAPNGRTQYMGAGRPGDGYNTPPLDYRALSKWCRSRRGQVMVCEQAGASWLPFRTLASLRASTGRMTKEAVWESGESQQMIGF